VGLKANVRRHLSLLGSTSMSEGFQKLDKDPEVALRLKLRWFANRDARPTFLELRVRTKEKTSVTRIVLNGNRRAINVHYCYEEPSKPGEVTHVWKPKTNIKYVTKSEITQSIERAQEMNKLLEESTQTHE